MENGCDIIARCGKEHCGFIEYKEGSCMHKSGEYCSNLLAVRAKMRELLHRSYNEVVEQLAEIS